MTNSIDISRECKLHLVDLLDERERRICEKSFYAFYRRAWSVIEPETPFVDNWHYEVLCDIFQQEAERVARREPKTCDYIVNVPPRTSKSTLFTKCANAWTWINNPHVKFLTASYDGALALEHAVDTRNLLTSGWYRKHWANKYELSGDQNVKSFFKNDEGGYRIAVSVTGSGTGRGGDIIIADDPQSQLQAESEAHRLTCNNWWDRTMYSRLNDQKIGVKFIIQQRLHEDDLTGHVLSQDGKRYKHICLPAEDSDDVNPTEYRKHYVQGYLFQEKLDSDTLEDAKIRLGSYAYAGQYSQRPAPAAGAMFKRHWWRYWQPAGSMLPEITRYDDKGLLITVPVIDLPTAFDDKIASWDMTFKNSKGSDRVSGQVWAKSGEKKFLLDQALGNMDFVQACAAVKRLKDKHQDVTAILIEDSANGPAVISAMKNKVSPLIPVHVKGSKTSRVVDASRAMSAVAQCEAGMLYLPHPSLAAWVQDYIEEFTIFPAGKHDDQVDATSQALTRLSSMVPLLYTSKDYADDTKPKR